MYQKANIKDKQNSVNQSEINKPQYLITGNRYNVVAMALTFGLFVWVIDAAFDYYIFYKGYGTYLELLISRIPAHELYIRLVIVGTFLIFGIIVASQISRRKKTQEALGESEEKHKALYNNAPLSYQSLDENGNFIDINPTWLKTLGYERKEVIGKWYGDFLHPDWVEYFRKKFPEFKKRGYVSDVQFKILHKEGHYIDISFEGCIGYHPDGSFKQTYCVFTDITKEQEIKLQLRNSEDRFRRFAENATDMIYRMALPSGRYVFVSPACEKIFGYTAEEFITNPKIIEIIIHPDWKTYFSEQWDNLNKGIMPPYYEYQIIHKSGENRWLNQRNVLIKNENNEPIAIEGIVTDITEGKHTQEELEKHRNHLEELVYDRTKKVEEQNNELERFNKLFVGREFRIKELRDKVKELENKVKLDNAKS